MAVGRAIITKIRRVQNTQKITKAMQMVATSKMRKTQELIARARPYADKIRDVMRYLAATHPDETLSLLEQRTEIKSACIVLITTDKGLCGSLNSNVLKIFFAKVREYTRQGILVSVVCFGLKGLMACQRTGLNVVASAVGLGDVPKLEILLGSLQVLFEQYENKTLDAVHLIYTKFVHTMRQESVDEYFLPVGSGDIVPTDTAKSKGNISYNWDYIFEPNTIEVLQVLVERYLESVVYQAVSDSMASEQAARMVAMKSATDNANNAIKSLQLKYNKSRQAAITTELSEIIAGATAI